MISLINWYETFSRIPLCQNKRGAGSISFHFGNQSSDFVNVIFVNEAHSHLTLFITNYCQYCKQIVHLKMLLKGAWYYSLNVLPACVQ